MVTSLPYIRIGAEDAIARGRQYGSAAETLIQTTLEFYSEYFQHSTGLRWQEIRRLAAQFSDPIAAYDREISAEIEGIAEGASLPVEDILAINVRTEIMFGLGGAAGKECTAFYVGPSASEDGHVYLGQNWDYYPAAGRSTALIEVEQGERTSFVMLAEAGLVGKLGFNAAGVGVATNFLLSDRDRGAVQVPYHVILRGILNSRSPGEAVAAVVGHRRGASANYLIGSAEGVGVDLETGPGGIESVFVIHPENDVLGHANNFTCAIGLGDEGVKLIPGSPGRMARMVAGLEAGRGSLTAEALIALLRDHDGHPDSICQHEDERLPPRERAASVASWVIDLTERTASVCAGQPCSGSYQTLAPSFGHAAASTSDGGQR